MLDKIKVTKTVQGWFGWKRKVRIKAFVPSTNTHISKIAGYAVGVSDGKTVFSAQTHHHEDERGERHILVGEKKGYDEFAYDAFIGILGGIASRKYGAEDIGKKYREILINKGKNAGEEYYSTEPIRRTVPEEFPGKNREIMKGNAVQLPSFDEFVEKHGEDLKRMLLEEIASKSPERISESEKEKISKTVETAVDAAKKLAEVYGNPERLAHLSLMEIERPDVAIFALNYLHLRHPLNVIGEHIVQLKKMHPDVVEPEKIYGSEWLEFLKKTGASE